MEQNSCNEQLIAGGSVPNWRRRRYRQRRQAEQAKQAGEAAAVIF